MSHSQLVHVHDVCVTAPGPYFVHRVVEIHDIFETGQVDNIVTVGPLSGCDWALMGSDSLRSGTLQKEESGGGRCVFLVLDGAAFYF